jgi:hypothetical protein
MKTNKNEEYKRPGQGCQCYAHSESECACDDVDWTDPLIYKQRDELREVRAALDSAQKRNSALAVVIEGAREYINKLEKEIKELKRDVHQPELCNERISELSKEVLQLRHLKKENADLTDRINEIDSDQNRAYENQILELKNQIAILKQENEIHLTRLAHYMSEENEKNPTYPLHWGGFNVDKNSTLKNLFNTNVTFAEAKVTEETPRMRAILNKLTGKKEPQLSTAIHSTQDCSITGHTAPQNERSWEEAAEILATRLVKLEEQIKNLGNQDYGQ